MMLLSATGVSFKTSAPFRLTGTVGTKLLTKTYVQDETEESNKKTTECTRTTSAYPATGIDPQFGVSVTSAGYLHLEVAAFVSTCRRKKISNTCDQCIVQTYLPNTNSDFLTRGYAVPSVPLRLT